MSVADLRWWSTIVNINIYSFYIYLWRDGKGQIHHQNIYSPNKAKWFKWRGCNIHSCHRWNDDNEVCYTSTFFVQTYFEMKVARSEALIDSTEPNRLYECRMVPLSRCLSLCSSQFFLSLHYFVRALSLHRWYCEIVYIRNYKPFSRIHRCHWSFDAHHSLLQCNHSSKTSSLLFPTKCLSCFGYQRV